MVSHDELMRFITNLGTQAPLTLPCTDVAAVDSTGIVGLSSNTGQGGREIIHCSGEVVSYSEDGKYSKNINTVSGSHIEGSVSSCNKVGGRSFIKAEDSCFSETKEYSSSKEERGSSNNEAGASSYNAPVGSSFNEEIGSSYIKVGRGGSSNQVSTESFKIGKAMIKPKFVTPTVESRSQNQNELSPRSKMLKDLRYHKNKPKQAHSNDGHGQERIDPCSSNAVTKSSWKEPSKQVVFARKSKAENKPTNEASDNGFVPIASPKKTIEISMDKVIAPELGQNLKKFVCEKCLKGFVYIQSLKSHQLKSKCDQKDFTCGQCNKKFMNNKSLKSHVITAHINPKFQCAECLKIFPTKKTVDAHMKHNHMLRECKFCK